MRIRDVENSVHTTLHLRQYFVLLLKKDLQRDTPDGYPTGGHVPTYYLSFSDEQGLSTSTAHRCTTSSGRRSSPTRLLVLGHSCGCCFCGFPGRPGRTG